MSEPVVCVSCEPWRKSLWLAKLAKSLQDWSAVSKLLPVIERELAPFQPRPHWGKLFTLSPGQLHSKYEKLPGFIALSQRFDPTGKFRNEFLNTNIFG